MFFSIILPLVMPTVFFVVMISTIATFSMFEGPLLLTAGGPAFSSTPLTLYLYSNAFDYFKMGYASALAVMMFLLIAAMSLVRVHRSSRHEHRIGGCRMSRRGGIGARIVRPAGRALLYLFLFALAAACVFPYYMMIAGSTKDNFELVTMEQSLWPRQVDLRKYVALFEAHPFGRILFNTLFYTATKVAAGSFF